MIGKAGTSMSHETTVFHESTPGNDDLCIVSYPGSGHERLRALIACLLNPDRASERLLTEPSSIETPERDGEASAPGRRLFSIHGSFDPRLGRVVYLVRDPRDVAVATGDVVSLFRRPADAAGSWFEQVGSWLGARQLAPDFLLLRYEDLMDDPIEALRSIVRVLDDGTTDARLAAAVEAFRSSPIQAMFGDDHPGRWRERLEHDDLAMIESHLGPMMEALGYPLETSAGHTVQRPALSDGVEATPPRIVTSIAPRGIEHQQRALASWRRLGFEVVSLNCGEEIGVLRPDFPDVEFVEVTKDGRAETGRPLVYLDDILDYFRRRDDAICGIVNSDIELEDDPVFADIVRREAADGLVYGSRIDFEDTGTRSGTVYRGGYDFFFFPRAYLDHYRGSGLMLGMPWWDYWLPVSTLLRGGIAKRLEGSFAFHEDHETNYSEEHYLGFGRRFAETTAPLLDTDTLRLLPSLAESGPIDIRRLGAELIRFLDRYSVPLTRTGCLAAPANDAGERAFADGDLAQAFERFHEALSISPQDVRTLNNLAVLSWRLGDGEAAEHFIGLALEQAPEDARTLANHIEIESASGRHERALEACRRYLEIWPDDTGMRETEATLRQRVEAQVETALAGLF